MQYVMDALDPFFLNYGTKCSHPGSSHTMMTSVLEMAWYIAIRDHDISVTHHQTLEKHASCLA